MPQLSVWIPTRSLAHHVANEMSKKLSRPVKLNELIHEALLAYARANDLSEHGLAEAQNGRT